jgi:hypothetical protein
MRDGDTFAPHHGEILARIEPRLRLARLHLWEPSLWDRERRKEAQGIDGVREELAERLGVLTACGGGFRRRGERDHDVVAVVQGHARDRLRAEGRPVRHPHIAEPRQHVGVVLRRVLLLHLHVIGVPLRELPRRPVVGELLHRQAIAPPLRRAGKPRLLPCRDALDQLRDLSEGVLIGGTGVADDVGDHGGVARVMETRDELGDSKLAPDGRRLVAACLQDHALARASAERELGKVSAGGKAQCARVLRGVPRLLAAAHPRSHPLTHAALPAGHLAVNHSADPSSSEATSTGGRPHPSSVGS